MKRLGKPTEMTLRDLLVEELRRREVVVLPEMSFKALDGRHLMPDLVLKDGAQYVVETKLGAETKLLDAMVRLYDYSKYVTEAKGAFAVLFPQELRQPWSHDVILNIAMNPKTEYVVTAIFKDLRPSQRFAGNLSEIADWMAGHVLRAPVVEADTGFAIRVLRDAVSYITASVRQLRDKELEDIFGGKTVFENILQYEEGRYPLEEMRQAATYLLVNQLLFYHVLSRMDASFPAVDEEKIGKPADLVQYFEPVLKRDYSSVFGFDVASRLPVDATEVVKKAVMVVKALAPEKIRHDLLGKVFHELIPFEIRKAVAAFYTNNEAAEILAQLAIDKPDAKVMDLAVGSGTLLVAAYRRKRELLQKVKGTIELEDHKRFLEQDLTGIDIMPFAAHLAVVHLSLQALLYETEKVRVAVWDSTELKPGQTIPAIWSELKAAYRRPTLDMFAKGGLIEEAYVTKGAVTLEGVGGEKIPLEKADLVVMNPPFTRQERLPTDYKEALSKRLQGYEDYLHGQLGLYGYFIFLADKFVKEGGKIALVLPATVLRVKSAQGVRRLLTENYHIEHIITARQRLAFSESAKFREILLVATKIESVEDEGEMKENTLKCTITILKRMPESLEEARDWATKVKTIAFSTSETYEDENFIVYKVSQEQLKALTENMFTLISVHTPSLIGLWTKSTTRARDKLAMFHDYLQDTQAEMKRGIETTRGGKVQSLTILADESMALKKSDVWIVQNISPKSLIAKHRFLDKEIHIPLNSLNRALRRVAYVSKLNVSSILDYVVSKKFPELEEFLKISTGKPSTRFIDKWREYVEDRLGNLAIVRRLNIAAPGTTLLAFYFSIPAAPPGVAWSLQISSEDDVKILTLWFNSSLNIIQTIINRKETGGAYSQIDEYTLKEFQVLDARKLSEPERKTLLEAFDEVKDADFPSILEQLKAKFPARLTIDRAVLRVLGFGDDEINRILDYLYPALANEIQQLKTLMQG